MFFESFCQPACFFAARFTLRQPKTSVRNATTLRTFCFSDYHYTFQETLCPVTLAHQIFVFQSSLYFYTYNTFRPILARFSHILPYTIFCLMYITTRNIFLIPDDVVARNLIIIFNFSSQRPHLNYIFLSNVYSFDSREFFMKHKCYLAHIYQQSFKLCCYCLIKVKAQNVPKLLF